MKIPILIITMLTLLFGGCAKVEVADNTRLVTFTIGNIESGKMTKSVADLLNASAPNTPVSIHLASKTNAKRYYDVISGEPTRIAIDTYTATARYNPRAVADIWKGGLYMTPPFNIRADITIGDAEEYSLPATYECWALVWDKTKVASYSIKNPQGRIEPPTCRWNESGDYALLYVRSSSQWTTASPLVISVTPVDDVNYGETTYNVVSGSADGFVGTEIGYWYALNPDAVVTSNGIINYTLPEWREGLNN